MVIRLRVCAIDQAVCTYRCICTCMCSYIYIYIHTYIHVYTYIHIYVCLFTYTYVYAYYIHVCIYICLWHEDTQHLIDSVVLHYLRKRESPIWALRCQKGQEMRNVCRVAKTHRIPLVADHFPLKSHSILVSFAEIDL